MKFRGEISINEVLSAIRAEPDRPFWLAFVRATGKGQGSVKIVAKCLYGAPKSESERIRDTEKVKSLHIEKGTLPVQDYDTGKYLTPLISHIVGYNLYKVIH